MSSATLTIDLAALSRNWQALNSQTAVETCAVVKADGYGLGAGLVATRLAQDGVRKFFVALAEEGAILRQEIGHGPEIFVFSGHMDGDTALIRDHALTPLLNSADQLLRHIEAAPKAPFGIQLDTGMNRLGMEPAEWAALKDDALRHAPVLLMSHLACADEPENPMNAAQLRSFRDMTDGLTVPRSLAATGGILLGPAYHFDLTRPGVGLYGGQPFADARPVVSLDIPVIQIREVAPGETVGYANAWTATRPSRVATIAAGYADGLIRAMGPNAKLIAGGYSAPVIGRVSMDLITVDVTDLPEEPEKLQLFGRTQTVDDVAAMAGTIGYEILTSLGHRYARSVLT